MSPQDRIAAYRRGAGENVPHDVLLQAAQIALSGNMHQLRAFMRSEGYPLSGAWCGEFAASVVRSAGMTPPRNPEIASSWRNFGTETTTPQAGDVAVRKGAATGETGSHVTFVGGVDPRTGTFTRVGGNQGPSNASPTIINSRPLSEYQFFHPGFAPQSEVPHLGGIDIPPANLADPYGGRDFYQPTPTPSPTATPYPPSPVGQTPVEIPTFHEPTPSGAPTPGVPVSGQMDTWQDYYNLMGQDYNAALEAEARGGPPAFTAFPDPVPSSVPNTTGYNPQTNEFMQPSVFDPAFAPQNIPTFEDMQPKQTGFQGHDIPTFEDMQPSETGFQSQEPNPFAGIEGSGQAIDQDPGTISDNPFANPDWSPQQSLVGGGGTVGGAGALGGTVGGHGAIGITPNSPFSGGGIGPQFFAGGAGGFTPGSSFSEGGQTFFVDSEGQAYSTRGVDPFGQGGSTGGPWEGGGGHSAAVGESSGNDSRLYSAAHKAGMSADDYEAMMSIPEQASPNQFITGYEWQKNPGFGGSSFSQPGGEGKAFGWNPLGTPSSTKRGYYAPVYGPTAPATAPIMPIGHGLSHGGAIHGYDEGYDTVPAMLEPGEVVLNREEQRHVRPVGRLPKDIANQLYKSKLRKAA